MYEDKPGLTAAEFLTWPARAQAEWYRAHGLKIIHRLRMALDAEEAGAPDGEERP